MPKIKNHRGAMKRFKITANGKVIAKKAFKNHILTKKNKKVKRNMRRGLVLEKGDAQNIKVMISN